MSWQREYAYKGTGCMAIFFGLVLAFIGLVFAVVFTVWAGALVLVAAVGVPLLMAYFGTNITVTCSDQGFRVRTESKRNGTTDVAYGWHEVTSTNYYETASRDADGDRNTTAHFEVETVRGKAFSITSKVKNFKDLVEVFNHMAPQVPYVWKPQAGFAVNLGPLTVRRGAYVSIPRHQAPPQ